MTVSLLQALFRCCKLPENTRDATRQPPSGRPQRAGKATTATLSQPSAVTPAPTSCAKLRQQKRHSLLLMFGSVVHDPVKRIASPALDRIADGIDGALVAAAAEQHAHDKESAGRHVYPGADPTQLVFERDYEKRAHDWPTPYPFPRAASPGLPRLTDTCRQNQASQHQQESVYF